MKNLIISLASLLCANVLIAQNVGIGTTAPGTKLTVQNAGFGWEHTNGTTSIKSYVNGGTAQVGTYSNNTFQLMANNGSNQFVLLPNGNVGIAIANPTERLTVQTATNSLGISHTDGTIKLGTFVGGAGTGGYLGTISNHPLYFMTNNGAAQITLLQNGNVGIGTTTPSLAGLVSNTKVGAINAMFGSNTTGVAIESSFPGIGLNSYYNSGRKAIATGFGGLVGLDPTTGRFYISTSAASIVSGASMATNDNLVITADGNVGIGTNTPNSQLQVAGSLSLPIKTVLISVTPNYNITDNDYTIYVPPSSDGVNIILPTPTTALTGRIYKIIGDPIKYSITSVYFNSNTNPVYIDVFYSTLTYKYYGATFQCTGTSWIIMDRNFGAL